MCNVILVDDDKYILNGLSKLIRWEDYDCSIDAVFSDAYAALSYCEQNNVSIVISDIRMPGMLGTELASRLRKINPRIITILLSAYESFDYARDAVNSQVFRYLVKPVDVEELKEAVTAAVFAVNQSRLIYDERSALLSFKKKQKCKDFLDALLHGEPMMQPEDETGVYFNFGVPVSYNLLVSNIALMESGAIYETDQGNISYCAAGSGLFFHILTGSGCDVTQWIQDLQNGSCLQKGRSVASLNIASLATLKKDCDRLSVYLDAKTYTGESFFILTPTVPERLFINNRSDTASVHSLSEKMINSFIKGDFKQVQDIVTIIDQLLTDPSAAISSAIIKGFFLKVVSDLAEYYEKYYPSHTESIQCILHCKDKINAQTNFCQDTDRMINLAHELYSQEFLKGDTSIQVVNMIKLFIDQSLDKEINIGDIAEAVHMSSSYVSALFKKTTGEKLWSYVTKKRLEKAYDYLTNTDLPISHIASVCGFKSVNTFYYCFKQQYNISPGQLRQ